MARFDFLMTDSDIPSSDLVISECDSSIIQEVAETEVEVPSINDQLEQINRKIDLIMCHLGIAGSSSSSSSCSVPLNPKRFANVRVAAFRKLKTLAQLNKFEEHLENDDYKSALMNDLEKNHFKDIEKYYENRRKLMYDVIDLFTDRKLFKKFSWQGYLAKNRSET